jgi:NAD-dependent SIR2 family protein deacetylase
MQIEPDYTLIEADDFARRFKMRAGNLMWLLGAGASAAAGVPTASDMVWDSSSSCTLASVAYRRSL